MAQHQADWSRYKNHAGPPIQRGTQQMPPGVLGALRLHHQTSFCANSRNFHSILRDMITLNAVSLHAHFLARFCSCFDTAFWATACHSTNHALLDTRCNSTNKTMGKRQSSVKSSIRGQKICAPRSSVDNQ